MPQKTAHRTLFLHLNAYIAIRQARRQYTGMQTALNIHRPLGMLFLLGNLRHFIVQGDHPLLTIPGKPYVRLRSMQQALLNILQAFIALVRYHFHAVQAQFLFALFCCTVQLSPVAGIICHLKPYDHMTFRVHCRLHVVAGFHPTFLRRHHPRFRVCEQQRSPTALRQFLQAPFMKRDPLLQLFGIRQMFFVQIQGHWMIQPLFVKVIFIQCPKIPLGRFQLCLCVFQLLSRDLRADRLLLSVHRAYRCSIQAQGFRSDQLHIFAGPHKNQEDLFQRLPVLLAKVCYGVVIRAQPVQQIKQLNVPPAFPLQLTG